METHQWLTMVGLVYQSEALLFGLIVIYPNLARLIVASNRANAGLVGALVGSVLGTAAFLVANQISAGPPVWVIVAFYVGPLVPTMMVFTHTQVDELMKKLAGAITFFGIGAVFQLAAFLIQQPLA